MDEDREYEEKLDYYMQIGVIELVGVDVDGEIIYRLTDKAETEAPELWQAQLDYIDDALIDLYQQGLMSIEYNEDLDAIINFTEEGYLQAVELGLIDPDDQSPEDD